MGTENAAKETYRLWDLVGSNDFCVVIGYDHAFRSEEAARKSTYFGYKYAKIRWDDDKGELDIRIEENPYFSEVVVGRYSMMVPADESMYSDEEKEMPFLHRSPPTDGGYDGGCLCLVDRWLTKEQFTKAIRKFEPDARFTEWYSYWVAPYGV